MTHLFKLQLDRFGVHGSDGISDIVTNLEGLILTATGKSDEERVGVTIHDLGVPVGPRMNELLRLLH
jgi:hypothetical protein